MADQPSKPRLAAAGAVSLLLHLVFAVLLAAWPRGPGHAGLITIAGAPESEHSNEPQQPPPERIPLGTDRSQSTSITWIGFDELIEHSAEKSEIDQPELNDDPAGEPVPADGAHPEPPPAEPAAPEPQAPPTPDEAPPPPDPPVAPQEEHEPAPASHPDEPPPDELTVAQEQDLQSPALRPLTRRAPPPPTPDEAPAPTEASPPAEAVREPSPAEPAPPQAPPAATAGEQGAEADRESPAASILTAEWKKLGQPLAGRGLEIRTRKPRFTQYTRLMGAARDPVVRVHFRRDGRVDKVEVVRSSGNPDVDRPVVDAVYQWRAEGEELSRLAEGTPPQTLWLEFRILMR